MKIEYIVNSMFPNRCEGCRLYIKTRSENEFDRVYFCVFYGKQINFDNEKPRLEECIKENGE